MAGKHNFFSWTLSLHCPQNAAYTNKLSCFLSLLNSILHSFKRMGRGWLPHSQAYKIVNGVLSLALFMPTNEQHKVSTSWVTALSTRPPAKLFLFSDCTRSTKCLKLAQKLSSEGEGGQRGVCLSGNFPMKQLWWLSLEHHNLISASGDDTGYSKAQRNAAGTNQFTILESNLIYFSKKEHLFWVMMQGCICNHEGVQSRQSQS